MPSIRMPQPKKFAAWFCLLRKLGRNATLSSLVYVTFMFAIGCRSAHESHKPSIQFTHVPPAQSGGQELLDHISGRVVDGQPGARIVLYAYSEGTWWVQPFKSHAFTDVDSDESWENSTHLGSEYASLLVAPDFRPPAKLSALPSVNGAVLAVATTKGAADHSVTSKLLRFSDYDWKVRGSAGDRGGELCDYEPSNAWVDEKGYLHLLMGPAGGQWHCAGISLTRSLGYGTYRFVIFDSGHLPPSAVLAMFTRDNRQDPDDKIGMAIELSQWGKARQPNADYVVQPYYIPGNTAHFRVPPGPMTYVLRWEPGSAEFKALKGVPNASHGSVMAHVFKSGIPVPASETTHLEFYDFHHSQSGLQHPVEIVVQKFEYLP